MSFTRTQAWQGKGGPDLGSQDVMSDILAWAQFFPRSVNPLAKRWEQVPVNVSGMDISSTTNATP